MNTNELSDEAEINNKYASQWIESLKKKNIVLNIIWPIFMCATIVCALTTFYYYQLSESTKSQLLTALSNLEISEGEVETVSLELGVSRQNNINLEDNIARLSDAKTTLEQQKGDSVSQLDLSGKMVDTLMEKIAALETENSLITEALETTKSLLEKHQTLNQTTSKSLETKIQAHNKERFTIQKKYNDGQKAFRALMSRQKEMRSEMNRLADLVEQKNKQFNQMKIARNKAESALSASELKVSTLEKDYIALQTSLKLSVEPISMATTKPDTSNMPIESSSNINNSDGLEEILAPVQ
jgi:chromosome segregation ATPase